MKNYQVILENSMLGNTLGLEEDAPMELVLKL